MIGSSHILDREQFAAFFERWISPEEVPLEDGERPVFHPPKEQQVKEPSELILARQTKE